MSRQTPRMGYTYPGEGDDPYFDLFQGFTNDLDAADYALSDDKNLIATGEVLFTWDAVGNLLSWDGDYFFSGFTTGFSARVLGPAQAEIQNGQILAFTMPRLLTADADVSPFVANRVAESDDVKIHDRTVICIRRGDTLYFRNGVTLSDGETGAIWERPVSPSGGLPVGQRNAINETLHEHVDFLWDRAGSSFGTLTNGTTDFVVSDPSPEVYRRFEVYKNGSRLMKPGDYSEDLTLFKIVLTNAIGPLDKHVLITVDRSKTLPI